MRKLISILSFLILPLIFFNHTLSGPCSIHSLVNTETTGEISNLFAENCEEEIMDMTEKEPFLLLTEKFRYEDISPCTFTGSAALIWQPPE
jgi:hypothetical protein